MKNIHLIPTDKPSRLYAYNGELGLAKLIQYGSDSIVNQHIYITSDEEIKEGDWVLGDFPDKPICKVISKYGEEFTAQSLNGNKHGLSQYDSKKIILATDGDLIKAGVQAPDDDFLEWFVKNPNCDRVDINYIQEPCTNCDWNYDMCPNTDDCLKGIHKIAIPKGV